MSDFASTPFAFPQTVLPVRAADARGNASGERAGASRQISSPSRKDIEQAIATAARATTVDFDYLVAQARVESAMKPEARARTSSATGLYQFIESTWLETVRRHGERFGLGDVAAHIRTTPGGSAYVADASQRAAILKLRNDPHVASLMAAGLAEDNRAHLMPILGRQPDAGELYLAHFLGAGGAGRFLSAMQDDPNQNAAGLFRRSATANRAVFYEPGGAPRSLAGVMNHLSAKIGRAMMEVPETPESRALPRVGMPAGYAPAYPLNSPKPVPYLITAEEVFQPRNPPLITGGNSEAEPPPRLPTAPTIPFPGAPRAPGSRTMSNLLSTSYEASGARKLASPESLERIERAYGRLRAMGL